MKPNGHTWKQHLLRLPLYIVGFALWVVFVGMIIFLPVVLWVWLVKIIWNALP